MGIRKVIRQVLSGVFERRYQAALCAKKMTYDKWVARCSSMQRESVEASAEKSGEALLEEAGILLLKVGKGIPAATAMTRIRAFFAEHPQTLMVYGDEDVMDPSTGKLSDPWYKPDWSPDTFLNTFYWGSVVAVRRDWLTQKGIAVEGMSPGELKRSLSLLAMEAGGFERGCRTIGHIPHILFHSVSRQEQEACSAWGTHNRDLKRYVEERVAAVRDCLISVIIPTKDHPDILLQSLQALFGTVGDEKCQVIVVDNGSCDKNRLQVEAFLQSAPIPCKYIYHPMEFNFSRMCNLGVQQAEGELFLFLNDDAEPACPGWLGQMAEKALQPHVGAVGLKLYYPGGRQLQHDGIVNLPAGPMHKLQFLTDDRSYYDGYNQRDRNVLAVTGACLMVHRDRYRQAGGMKESLTVSYNDVELCFGLWELGFHNVVINSAYGYHHESLSRGEDSSLQKRSRLAQEREQLYTLHPCLKGRDPYYSGHLNCEAWDTGIRPAYVTAGNQIQEAVFREVSLDLRQYRRDDCLLLGLESCEGDFLQGYSVVLSDNNACYDRWLILWQQDKENVPQGEIRCLIAQIEGQYRPDLEENMEDQTNVALCGFLIKPSSPLRAGTYRPGILARSRVSSIRLVNFSNRVLKIEP